MKRLDLSNLGLYGRDSELIILQEAYKRVTDLQSASSEAVLVHGPSGTGKSTLIKKLQTWIDETEDVCKCYFVCGKFDQQRASEPYYAVTTAFNKLCDLILESSDKDKTIARVKEAVGSKGNVLIDVVPRASDLLGDVQADKDTKDSAAASLNQLLFVFREFVRSVCSVTRQPVVYFLDDLQWADAASLDLAKSILTDTTTTQVLFTGSYRDNETTDAHLLVAHFQQVDAARDTIKIPLGDLDEETVNDLISEATQLNPSLTKPLTGVVYQKTRGNDFFVIQFLQLLEEEKYLYFSMTTYKWTWDIDRIKAETDLSDNVVDLVSGKINRLPEKVRAVLKLASCVWSTFEVDLMQDILVKGEAISQESDRAHFKYCFDFNDGIVGLLDIAADEGLLDKLSETRYKFAHDRIQQAAYSLIPEGRERDLLHLGLGELLWQMTESPRREEWMYFAAADQMNRGSALIVEEERRVDTARLNLQVAEKAIALSAFVPAESYLKTGIGYLPSENQWSQQYRLCLKLHNSLAEMEGCNGDVDSTRLIVSEILVHARSYRDKIGALYTLGTSLFAKGDHRAAIELAFDVLRELGETPPRRVTKITASIACLRLRQKLQRRSDNELLAMPLMNDVDKIAAMKFFDMAYTCIANIGKMQDANVLATKMMWLSLNFGICELSPVAFYYWGDYLAREGEIQNGFRFGKLALKLSERVGSDAAKARITAFVCCFLNHWMTPVQQNLDPLLQAHKVGMINGETTWAFASIIGYQVLYFYGGLPLDSGTNDIMSFTKLMKEYKQENAIRLISPVLQLMLNLMGRSKNVLELTGEAMNQNQYMDKNVNPEQTGVQSVASCRMQLAYYFGNLEMAAELSKWLQRIAKTEVHSASYFVCARTMFFGLISIALARKTKKRKYVTEASKIIAFMEKTWVKLGAVNCVHKLLILKAEYATIKPRDVQEVKDAFDKAITTTKRVGFLQDEALTNERAGLFFLEEGDRFWASSYLSRAHELYAEWGAQAKAQQLEDQHGSFLVQNEHLNASHLRGRERFSLSTTKRHKTLRANDLLRSDIP